jgi:general secretion pathway protein L
MKLLGVDNWRQRLRDAVNRAGLPRFWHWWLGELAPLLPGASRIALQRRFVRPVIEFADDEALFWRPEFDGGAVRLVIAEKLSLIGDAAAVLAAGRAAVARIAASASGGLAAPKVVIALSPRKVLRKDLTLPAAVEENLAQALAYDLDRHTPFRPEQLYFDAVVAGRDAAKKTLRVDWAAALKSVVDDACKQVEAWGAVPRAVVPGPPATGTKLNLIPLASRARPLQWGRWEMWAPLAVVVALALAAVIVPLVQKREYAIALNALTAEASKQAEAADAVRQQLDRMQDEYNYILAKKYAYPSVVHVLEEVTRALPDDTWLTQFELKTSGRGKEAQREIYVRGESANAGKLIALLEDTKLVEQAAPRSPTTKIQGASGEIFDIGGRLHALAAPSPEAVAIGSAPVAPAAVRGEPVEPRTPPAAAKVAAPAQPAARAPTPQPTANAPPPEPMRAAPLETLNPTTAAGFGPFPKGYVPPPDPAQEAAERPARTDRPARAARHAGPASLRAAPAAPPAAATEQPAAPEAQTEQPAASGTPPAAPAEAAPDEED